MASPDKTTSEINMDEERDDANNIRSEILQISGESLDPDEEIGKISCPSCIGLGHKNLLPGARTYTCPQIRGQRISCHCSHTVHKDITKLFYCLIQGK